MIFLRYWVLFEVLNNVGKADAFWQSIIDQVLYVMVIRVVSMYSCQWVSGYIACWVVGSRHIFCISIISLELKHLFLYSWRWVRFR